MATAKSTPKKTTAKKAAKSTAKTAAKKKAAPAADNINKLRIKVHAYEYKVLDASVKQILDTALRYDGVVNGPVPLPTNKRTYTVNRSPFISKDAREQFWMRVHTRLLDIMNPNQKIIEALTNIELPTGVGIDLQML